MRRPKASWSAGAAAILALSCGGSAFVIGPAEDATAGVDSSDAESDGDSEADAGVLDVGPDDAVDARERDGRGGTKDAREDGADGATQGDARSNDASDRDASKDALTAGESGPDDAAADARPDDAADSDSGAPPPACPMGFSCAPAVPPGWAGPFELYAGPKPVPACGAGFAGGQLTGYAGLSAPPAMCACACGPAAVQCTNPSVQVYESVTSCNATGAVPCSTRAFTPGACTTVDPTGACDAGALGLGVTIPATTVSDGGCAPQPVTTLVSTAWTTSMRACAASATPPGASCAPGEVCAPTPAPPFDTAICIEQPGVVPACPLTDYTVRRIYYTGVDDLRGCSTCSCGAVSGASCTETLAQFPADAGGCSGAKITYSGGQCLPVAPDGDLQLTLAATGGACTPSPVAPTGSALRTGPMTFCCF